MKINISTEPRFLETCSLFNYSLPALVDGFDDSTDTAYSGWPDRLYLIDREGRIAYRSNPGPFGFKPEELETALRAHLPAARP